MSAPALAQFFISPEDYLAGERVSPIKHEYQRGMVYAMAGVKKPHALITVNLSGLLYHHLRNRPCAVFASEMKVYLEQADCYYYPDILVCCEKQDIQTPNDFVLRPVLIVEVLSASTKKFDRGEKFTDYQTLSSLQEYVLVSQNVMQVEVFRRSQEGPWEAQVYGYGDRLELHCLGFSCAVKEIYQKVVGVAVR
jgi:Uma2 family endonuclease